MKAPKNIESSDSLRQSEPEQFEQRLNRLQRPAWFPVRTYPLGYIAYNPNVRSVLEIENPYLKPPYKKD